MGSEQTDRNNDSKNKDAALKPDPETLHKTDPQENMRGPVSSMIQGTGEGFKSDESKREAEEKREKNM